MEKADSQTVLDERILELLERVNAVQLHLCSNGGLSAISSEHQRPQPRAAAAGRRSEGRRALHRTATAGPGTLPQPVPPPPVTEPDKPGSALLSSTDNSRHQRNHQETLSRAARRERRHGCPGDLAVRRGRSQQKPSAALRGDEGKRRRLCWGRTSARGGNDAEQHGGGGRGAPEGTEGCGRSTPAGRPSPSAAQRRPAHTVSRCRRAASTGCGLAAA